MPLQAFRDPALAKKKTQSGAPTAGMAVTKFKGRATRPPLRSNRGSALRTLREGRGTARVGSASEVRSLGQPFEMGATSLGSFQLSIVAVDPPVPTVLDVFCGHDTLPSS